MSHFTPRQRLGSIPVLAPTTPLRNVIHHGDCIDVMAQMPDSSVDMILTDPPYICRYRDRQGRTVANDNNDRWLAPAFQEAYRVLKPDSLCISFYGFHVIDRFMASWRAAGFRPAFIRGLPGTDPPSVHLRMLRNRRHNCRRRRAQKRDQRPGMNKP